jgi:hypothetical protein
LSCSHRDSNLVAVAQFLAVAARPCFLVSAGGLMILNTAWPSSLVPKPSGVCRNRAWPAAWTVSRLPLAAAALSAAKIRISSSSGGSRLRNTTCTILGFGSSGYGLAASTCASSSLLRTTTDDQIPNRSSMADSSAAASLALSVSAVLNSTLPLWM